LSWRIASTIGGIVLDCLLKAALGALVKGLVVLGVNIAWTNWSEKRREEKYGVDMEAFRAGKGIHQRNDPRRPDPV
jgi:hypothetical protein